MLSVDLGFALKIDEYLNIIESFNEVEANKIRDQANNRGLNSGR